MKIRDLREGDRFNIPFIRKSGRVVKINPGSVRVRYDEETTNVEIAENTVVERAS